VLLAVNSKNSESNAKLGFSHPNMVLKPEDIAVFIANFDDKATNCLRIAKALNVKPDALVFVDDNPFERNIVSLNGQGVMVIDLPEDPALYLTTLQNAHAFDWAQITEEDQLRIQAQAKETEREALMTSAVDYPSYLKSLKMTATAELITPNQVERFTQLTNKSNQFNLRTIRVTEAEVLSRLSDPNAALLAVDLSDQFSPYGIIACVTMVKHDTIAVIENWVMSCRVLNRTVEELTLNRLIEIAQRWGCDTLVGEYVPTAKNALVETLYSRLGFKSCGNHRYELPIPTPLSITYIQKRSPQ
jgi:FkbH-like protein